MTSFNATVYPVVFSDERHDLEVRCGCVVADMLGDRHAVVIASGRILQPEEYALYAPEPGEDVIIRTVPTAPVVAVVAALGPVIGAIGGKLALFGLSATAWSLIGIGISVVGMIAQRMLIKPPKPPAAPREAERLPGIAGQSNTLAPFGAIDKVYGRVRVVPKLGAKPYTEIAGSDQYLRMLLVVGHGPLNISDIRIGETPITLFDDYEIEVRPGHWDDDPITLYRGVVAEEALGIAMDETNASAVRTLGMNVPEASIDITFPSGLGRQNEKDFGVSRVKVGFKVELRNRDGGDWFDASIIGVSGDLKEGGYSVIRFEQKTVTRQARKCNPSMGKDGRCWIGSVSSIENVPVRKYSGDSFHFEAGTRDTIRGSARFEVPADGQYDVRVTRRETSEGNSPIAPDAQRAFTKASWSVMRSIDTEIEPVNHPKPLAMIALRIKATDQLNGVIDNLSCVASSLIDVPGEGWVETASPAWQFHDALTGLGVRTKLDPAKIMPLQPFAEFCADRGYEFNAIVQPGDRFSVIQQVLSFGRGSLDMSDGKFGVIWEREQPSARQMFTPRNSWGFQGEREYVKVPHALRVKYLDPVTWEQSEVVVYRQGFNDLGTGGNEMATEFEIFDISYGCANLQQAIRAGHEAIREAILRPETFRLTTDIEHMRVKRGDRVQHAHDAILVGLGSARIAAIDGSDVTFDEAFPMEAGKAYAFMARDKTATLHTVPIITTPGEWSTVTLADGLPSEIEVGDLITFGEADRITQDLIVKSIEPGEERDAVLELIPYAPEIYAIDQPMPDYDATITAPVDIQKLPPPKPVIEYVRSDESAMVRGNDGSLIAQIVSVLGFPSGNNVPVARLEGQWRKQGTETWESDIFDRGERLAFPRVEQGETYEIRWRSISPWGATSDWATATETVIGNTTPPPDVTGLEAVLENFAGKLRWDAVEVIDIEAYHVEQKVGGEWQRLATVDATEYKTDVLPTGGTASQLYEFRVRAVDIGGLVSEAWAYASITINVPKQPSVAHRFDGPNFVLTWDEPAAQFPISHYIVRRDGLPVDAPKTNLFTIKADWGGQETWSIAAVDVAGNESAEASITVEITPPSVEQRPSRVIGNNVLLYWDGARASLPIDHYRISVGPFAESAIVRGTVSTTFFALFESQGGTYRYWVTAVDTAGNESAASSRENTLTDPGGYRLFSSFRTPFEVDWTTTETPDGIVQAVVTHENAMLEAGGVVLPVDTSEEYGEHFASRGWASEQDQIDAGYPIYAQPGTGAGHVSLEYDCGVVVPGSKITAEALYSVIAGSPTVSTNIEVRESSSDPWEDLQSDNAYTTSFRFIRVTVNVTGDDKALVKIDEIGAVVAVEVITESGAAQVTANPTAVTPDEPFIDISSIVVSIADGQRGYAGVDWDDEPDSFNLYAWDLDGNPINALVSYTITGS